MGLVIYGCVMTWLLCSMGLYAVYYGDSSRQDKARMLLLSPIIIAAAPAICFVMLFSAVCHKLPELFRDAFRKK